ncbi:hypothetical protein GCM10007860_08980 [Chitiniphilus shinanonensis]|uniref:Uncharacterized protein n=1 Tax=Chitiniphilus shinanonensis TaxID=553088 RepID=A0ABQ6BV23_9NEIS|nr:hypothetical protein [Chitiniphilus shinanonensis]GLS03753.1 hypothetical protein GCM10007860_08980 [Chitiniphilus shinanonensis]
MSPLWIEHSAWLMRHDVLLASQGRPGGGALRRQRGAIDNNADTAVMRLQQLLADAPRGPLKLDSLQVVLGSAWVRYAVVPWQDGLYKDSDWQQYAGLIFARQFATSAESWRISVAPAAYGKPRLAAAVDQGFYQTLAELARSQKLRLSGLMPLLTSAINRHHGKLKGKEFGFLMLEAEHATCLFRSAGGWGGIVTLPNPMRDEADQYALGALVRDAAMLAGQELPEQLYIASSEVSMLSGEVADFDVQWLGGVHNRFAHRSEWADTEVRR